MTPALRRLCPALLLALGAAACAVSACTVAPQGEARERAVAEAEHASAVGDWERAAGLWNDLRRHSDEPRPTLGTARALRSLGRDEDALLMLDHGLGRFPGDPGLLEERAGLLVEMGFRRAAEQDLREALRADPDRGTAWAALAEVQLELDLPLAAVSSSEQAWMRGVDEPDAWLTGARALRAVGLGARAHEAYARALGSRLGEDPRVLTEAATLACRASGGSLPAAARAEALAWAARACERDPQDAQAHFVRGLLLAEAGRSDQAVTALRRAIEVDVFHLAALTRLALLHRSRGEYEALEAILARAIALERDPTRRAALQALRPASGGDEPGADAPDADASDADDAEPLPDSPPRDRRPLEGPPR